MCKCADEIVRATGNELRIPDLVNIVVEYMHTFSMREHYELPRNWAFTGYADGSTAGGCDMKPRDPLDTSTLWMLKSKFPGEIQMYVTHVNIEGVVTDRRIALKNSFWDSLSDQFSPNNREYLWQKTISRGPCPVEFNAACDYMLEYVQNYLYERPRNLVCQWDVESQRRIPWSG